MRTSNILLVFVSLSAVVCAQTDWPMYGHDLGGQQFSPLKQITPQNVSKLKVAWTYELRPAGDAEPPPPPRRPGVRLRHRRGAHHGRASRRRLPSWWAG